jgi:hypothetical protein
MQVSDALFVWSAKPELGVATGPRRRNANPRGDPHSFGA